MAKRGAARALRRTYFRSAEVVACASGAGNPSEERKTRFPTAMRMDKGMAHYALSFCNWNVGKGSYSFDWREA
jgi:hypothetical protein